MANVTQLKHLEHLEDEMLNYGVEGCKAAVAFLQELRKMMGCDNSAGFMQTKWDGAPAIICGIDPLSEKFFVGTKSVFNKDEPKMACTANAVDMYYGHSLDLAEKLKWALRYFPSLGITGVVQGDLLFTKPDIKTETVHGEKLYTFKPNTITYGIPVDHEIGKQVSTSQIGVVFHTHYRGEEVPTMQAVAGAKVKGSTDVLSVDNDTPMDKVGLSHTEEVKFDNMVKAIDRDCKICGDFGLSETANKAKRLNAELFAPMGN